MLFTIAMGEEGIKTITRLRWLGAPEPWVSVLVFMGIIVVTAFIYWLERGTASRSYKIFLSILRVIVIATALLIYYEPIISTEQIEVRRATTLLLIDESLSMSFKDRYEETELLTGIADMLALPDDDVKRMTRIRLLKQALSSRSIDFIGRLTDKNTLRVYTFAERLSLFGYAPKGGDFHLLGKTPEQSRRWWERLKANGKETRLIDAMNDALNDMRGQRISAMIVVTDGQNTAGALSADYLVEAAKRAGVPIHTVGVGTVYEPKDVALVSIDAQDVVLKGDEVPISFRLKSQGYENMPKEAILEVDGKRVDSKTITLIGRGTVQTDSFTYKPEEEGEFELTVRVPVDDTEQFKDNNVLTHRIRVVEQKIKVLYVENAPRWEYHYLKNAMIRDKTIQVQCLLQEADPSFPQESSEGVPPIVEFPTSKKELFENYHVVVFGDVNPNHIRHGLSSEQMEWIKEFVEKVGGGFLMIAGEDYSPSRYVNTPIEELLPILPQKRYGTDLFRTFEPKIHTFHMKLTPEGKESIVMRLINDKSENIEFWEDNDRREENSLPGLFWYYKAERAKPTAVVLATHPKDIGVDDKLRPIIAYQHYGKGTTMFVGVDSTWRWRFGVGDLYFYRFWQQVLRFLATQALLGRTKRFSLSTDKVRYYAGQTVTLSAFILDKDFKPIEQPHQSVTLLDPDGKLIPLKMVLDKHNPGNYTARFKPKRLGFYKAWLGGAEIQPEEAPAHRSFRVEVPPLEKSKPSINESLLKEIASRTGGTYFHFSRFDEVPKRIESIEETISTEVSEKPLWDKWYILVLFTALITVEWIARRLRRML